MRRGAERNDGCCIQDSRAHSTPYKEYNATMASPYSESSKQSNYHSRCSREEGDRRTGLRIRDEDTESALNQLNHHLLSTEINGGVPRWLENFNCLSDLTSCLRGLPSDKVEIAVHLTPPTMRTTTATFRASTENPGEVLYYDPPTPEPLCCCYFGGDLYQPIARKAVDIF